MGEGQLESIIDKAWEDRESITSSTTGEIRDAVEAALESMDSGKERVASPLGDHKWRVNQWLKKAVLLSFRLNDMEMISGGPGDNQRVHRPGGIRYRQSSQVGQMSSLKVRGSELCQIVLFAVPRT